MSKNSTLKMIAAFSMVLILLLSGCLNTLPEAVDGVFESPNGAGTLIVEDGVRLLKLSGANYEMGFAHGYLLAEEILYSIDNFVFYLAFLSGRSYEELCEDMQYIDWENAYGEELQGMYDGICEKLSASKRFVHFAGKPKLLEPTDLQILNSVSDWGCSSFSAWGEATDDGSVIYARNLDYFAGKDEAFKNMHVLVSYDDGEHNSWVTASVAGFIGCITGMNEHGLTLGLQDTNQFSPTQEYDIVPRCIILRHIAEDSQADWTPEDIAEYMENYQGYLGMNLHVTFPSTGRTDDEIAGIIEYDGNSTQIDGKSTLRSPSENTILPYADVFDQRLNYTYAIITTNHYLKRKTFISQESAGRYVTIKNQLLEAKADGNVSIDESVNIMRSVGGSGTVHTTVFETDERILHFYLAEPGFGGFDCTPVTYEFEEMF